MTAGLSIEDLKFTHFTTESEHTGQTICVRLRGNADAQTQQGLQSLLRQLDTDAKRLVVHEAVVDLRDLYFMNSSCLSLLLHWITALAESESTPSYRIRFVSNPNLRWQKRSFATLGLFGKNVVSVE